MGRGENTLTSHPVSQLNDIFINTKWQIPALEHDKKRWAERKGEGKRRGRWGPTHCHDSGIVIASQQSYQHRLTASPNNQLRTEDRSQQWREKKAWERQERQVDSTALLWTLAQVFSLTAVSSASCFYLFMPLMPFSQFREEVFVNP